MGDDRPRPAISTFQRHFRWCPAVGQVRIFRDSQRSGPRNSDSLRRLSAKPGTVNQRTKPATIRAGLQLIHTWKTEIRPDTDSSAESCQRATSKTNDLPQPNRHTAVDFSTRRVFTLRAPPGYFRTITINQKHYATNLKSILNWQCVSSSRSPSRPAPRKKLIRPARGNQLHQSGRTGPRALWLRSRRQTDRHVSGRNNDTAIEQGKITGDEISFQVTREFSGQGRHEIQRRSAATPSG
jgi:hypothetical protein